MRKIKLVLSFVFCILLFPQFGWSQTGAAALTAVGTSLAGSSASSAQAAIMAPICASSSPAAPPACIELAKAIAQMFASNGGAEDNARAGAAVTSGDFSEFEFDPNEAGFCLDSAQGCKADVLDNQLKPFGDALKTGTFEDGLKALNKSAEQRLKTLSNKGFKLNRQNGTVTGPNGKVTNLSSVKTNLPKSIRDAYAKKVKAIRGKTGGRGVASTGGSGGGVSYKDEYYGGSLSRKKRKSKDDLDKKKRKNSLLAGLSDKDAQKAVIGVHGDNIFGMVNRRYEKKTKSSEFMKK